LGTEELCEALRLETYKKMKTSDLITLITLTVSSLGALCMLMVQFAKLQNDVNTLKHDYRELNEKLDKMIEKQKTRNLAREIP
jgi:hypothetical protein